MIHRDVPYKKIKWQEFGNNHDKIFGVQNGTKTKEERTRKFKREQHIESYKFVEWKPTDFQEGCMRYAKYNVQYR